MDHRPAGSAAPASASGKKNLFTSSPTFLSESASSNSSSDKNNASPPKSKDDELMSALMESLPVATDPSSRRPAPMALPKPSDAFAISTSKPDEPMQFEGLFDSLPVSSDPLSRKRLTTDAVSEERRAKNQESIRKLFEFKEQVDLDELLTTLPGASQPLSKRRKTSSKEDAPLIVPSAPSHLEGAGDAATVDRRLSAIEEFAVRLHTKSVDESQLLDVLGLGLSKKKMMQMQQKRRTAAAGSANAPGYLERTRGNQRAAGRVGGGGGGGKRKGATR